MTRTTLARSALCLAALACLATSRPPMEASSGQVFLHNASDQELVVQVRELSSEVLVDCEVIGADPGGLLSDAVFGRTITYNIGPGEGIGLGNGGAACGAVLLDGATGPALVWTGDAPWSSHTWGEEPSDLTLVLTGDGVRDPGDLIVPRDFVPDQVDPSCEPGEDRERLYWSEDIPTGARLIEEADLAPDGCFALALEGVSDTFYLCAPPELFPWAEGDLLGFSEIREAAATGLLVTGLGYELTLMTGDLLPLDGELEADCPYVQDPSCGTVSAARSLTTPLTGELPNGASYELVVVHNESRALVVPECSAGPQALGTDIEWALLTWSDQ